MNLLRALVRTGGEGGVWEAQLLELDIVVDAPTLDALFDEIAYVLTAEYTLAVEYGQTPFINIVKCPPQALPDGFAMAGNPKLRQIALSDEVILALSLALLKPKLQPFSVQLLPLAKTTGNSQDAPTPAPGTDATTADGRFISGSGYGGERM